MISAACLILGFQNCSQSNLQSGEGISPDVLISAPATVGEEPSAVTSKVTFVEVPNISEDAVQGKASSQITRYRLVVSLQSGSINLMDDGNNVIEKRCLNSSALQELKTILTGSSICAATIASDADMCAQSYTPGYASLYADDQRIALGEKRDSCGTGQKDLCGGIASVFQNYVAHLRQNWEQMACEN